MADPEKQKAMYAQPGKKAYEEENSNLQFKSFVYTISIWSTDCI